MIGDLLVGGRAALILCLYAFETRLCYLLPDLLIESNSVSGY